MNNENKNLYQNKKLQSNVYNKNNFSDLNNSEECSKMNRYKNLKKFDSFYKRVIHSDFLPKKINNTPKNYLLSLRKNNIQQTFQIKSTTNHPEKDNINEIVPNIKSLLNNEITSPLKNYDNKNNLYSPNNNYNKQIILPKISRNEFHLKNGNENVHNIKNSNNIKKSISLENVEQKLHKKVFLNDINDKKYNSNFTLIDKNFVKKKALLNKKTNDDGNNENIDTNEKKILINIKYKLKFYFYSILPGNASYLIENCMCHRKNWKASFNKSNSLFNFKWQQLSYGIDYNSLGKNGEMEQIVNHYENHYAISNKANMFINLMQYCEKRKISVFKYVPFTIIFELKNTEKLNEEEKNSDFQEKIRALRKFFRISKDFLIDYEKIGNFFYQKEFYTDLKKREKIANYISEFVVYSDHFPKLKEIDYLNCANKDKKELKEKEQIKKIKKYKILDKKNENKNIGEKTCIEIPSSHFDGKNMWVVKAINLNRGKCIQIVNNFNQMQAVINKFKNGVDYDFTKQIIEENQIKENEENLKSNDNSKDEKLYNCNKIIIQKYIENPLLYKGRKCDMRIWVLITHEMKVFIFKEGHLKTCSVEYDINSKNAFTHITNYSFQKYNDSFEKFEKGNEVPFYEFQNYINETYLDLNYDIKVDLMNQIKEIVNLTMRSVSEKINKNGRKYQFEIFGYDFMLDSDFNLFLIEINSNPGLEESSPWIKIIVPRMLDDALRLTIDKIFEPGYDFKYNYNNEQNNSQNICIKETEEKNDNEKYISPFPVPGYNLSENLWEFVCDLKENI